MGILQASTLEWISRTFSRGSSQPTGWNQVSHIAGKFFTIWATRETQEYWSGFSSVAQSYPTLCDPMDCAHQASLSITNSWSLLKLVSIKVVMPSNRLKLCRPLLLLHSIFPSSRVFSSQSVLRIKWPKYWSFSFSISPFNEYSGLISFRIDWLDLLAVLEWVAYPFSKGSSWSRNWTRVFCIAGKFFISWAIGEAQIKDICIQNNMLWRDIFKLKHIDLKD